MEDAPNGSSPDASNSTIRIFAAWIEEDPRAADREIDSLCRAHPAEADELRELAAAYESLAEAVPRLREDPPPARTLALMSSLLRVHGIPPGAPDGDPLVQRLAARILDHVVADPPAAPRYLDREMVGEGAMGQVFRAWDPRLRRHMARKVLKAGPSDAADIRRRVQFLARFLAEAQVTSQLQHPSIVPVHDIGIDPDGRLYYTMPLIRGRTLQDVFRSHAGDDPDWQLPRVLSVVVRICEALAFAHARGVVHRDLKPANVMVGEFGETYVMDWGLAYIQDSEADATAQWSAIQTDRRDLASAVDSPLRTREDHLLGTPSYMAPEQAADPVSGTGPLSDLYGIGAILYELTTGLAPYAYEARDGGAATVIRLLKEGPPAPALRLAPDTPAQLAAIIEKAMARDPRERYADALGLARDLQAFLGHRPTTAAHLSRFELLKLAVRRNRALFGVSALATVVVIGGLVTFLVLQRSAAAARERMLDFTSAEALLDQSEDIYPIHPDSVPRMREWLGRAEELLATEAAYRAEGESGGGPSPPTGRDLVRMLENIGAIRAIVPRIEEHLSVAESLERICFVDHAALWGAAIESIRRSPRYGGLLLPRQMGLVPLREDPGSGLWEFWIVASGRRPEPLADRAGYELDADTGMVLVLLPACEASIGSRPNPHRLDNEIRRKIPLRPYFIGKYEVTQALWTRLMHENPSHRNAARRYSTGQTYGWTHPVERINWYDASHFASMLGGVLPTEVQWENACRAGHDDVFGYGGEPSALRGRENVLDLSCQQASPQVADWDDGYPMHAPVGAYVPNDFGLYDMLGNVSEWCRDPYQLDGTYRAGDGLQTDPTRELNDSPVPDGVRLTLAAEPCVRGGSWYMPITYCRPANRNHQAASATHNTFGMRIGWEVR